MDINFIDTNIENGDINLIYALQLLRFNYPLIKMYYDFYYNDGERDQNILDDIIDAIKKINFSLSKYSNDNPTFYMLNVIKHRPEKNKYIVDHPDTYGSLIKDICLLGDIKTKLKLSELFTLTYKDEKDTYSSNMLLLVTIDIDEFFNELKNNVLVGPKFINIQISITYMDIQNIHKVTKFFKINFNKTGENDGPYEYDLVGFINSVHGTYVKIEDNKWYNFRSISGAKELTHDEINIELNDKRYNKYLLYLLYKRNDSINIKI